MLADERSSALADNFAGQWLETRNLDSVKPDPKKFPEWGPELRDAMKTETRMFFESMLRENRPLSEFLDAKYTFLNERLAKHYGIEGVTGPEFRRVELTTDQRGGILSQASVLYGIQLSDAHVAGDSRQVRAPEYPGSAAAGAAAGRADSDEEAVGNAGSLRQQLEKHRSNAICASCHNRMDVLGFGWKTTTPSESGAPWTASSRWIRAARFPNGKSFSTPAEMRGLAEGRPA